MKSDRNDRYEATGPHGTATGGTSNPNYGHNNHHSLAANAMNSHHGGVGNRSQMPMAMTSAVNGSANSNGTNNGPPLHPRQAPPGHLQPQQNHQHTQLHSLHQPQIQNGSISNGGVTVLNGGGPPYEADPENEKWW